MWNVLLYTAVNDSEACSDKLLMPCCCCRENPQDDDDEEEESSSSSSESEAESDAEGEREETKKRPGGCLRAVITSFVFIITHVLGSV
jgi:hypothetical protein